MLCRQKTGREVAVIVVRQPVGIGQDDELRQVLVDAPQSITDPCAHAGKTGQREAGVLHIAAETVDVCGGVHRHEEREIVHDRRHVRQHITHPATALAVLPKCKRAFEHFEPGRIGY